MNILNLLKAPEFFYNLLSSLINRIDAFIKRSKRKKEMQDNSDYDNKIDEMIDEVLIDDINKELGWDKNDEKN
jgi:5-bromo-4-chloroindolyl phosphate hydrolysis protein